MSDSFDSLLTRTEHRNRAPSDRCPEADVLAAYLDATLSASERAAVAAHSADCSRCALQLATIVRLEDESGHSRHASPQRWWPRVAWMVPAAAAALVAALYLARPSDVPPPPNAALSDRVAAAKDDAAAPTAPAESPAPSPPEPAADNPRLRARKSGPVSGGAAPSAMEAPSTDMIRRQEGAQEKVREQDRADNQAPVDASASATRARQRALTSGSLSEAVELKRASSPLVVRSPDGRVLWRVTGTRIERSADGGSTWTPEHAPAVESISLGAAPSVDVCWMASQSGAVLRRMADGTWLDVSPSPRASIVRLESTAVLEATVQRADGSMLTTVDGGRTWTH